jgi:hypothetical protein
VELHVGACVVDVEGIVLLLEHAGRVIEVHVHAHVHIVQPAEADMSRRPCCASKVTKPSRTSTASGLRNAQK